MLPVVIVFAKAPLPGNVKTRLTPPLTPEQAATLHGAFVRDIVQSLQCLKHVSLELHTDIKTDAWSDLDVARRLQCEGDLGLKMLKAIGAALGSGAPRVLVLGSDSPTLPIQHIDALLQAPADISLGPADDGGYYAIAASRTHPRMFDGVRWSAPHALEDTIAACRAAGLSTALGPSWFDVDTILDLRRILNAQRIPPHTAAALKVLTLRHGEKSA